MNRALIAGVLVVIVAGLALWQQSRARLVNTCTAAGGLWDGASSTCRPAPGSPIIQRDIRRS